MSLSIWLGIIVGSWALLSVVSGEVARQKQEIEAAEAAKAAAAPAPAEEPQTEVS